MEGLNVIAHLLGGGLVLSWGANLFVQSASKIARRFGISPVIIGLTVVAIGTSAPELAVNIMAALQGNPDIAMGNVVGSNIFNIAFILGICALIKSLNISRQLIIIDFPFMVGASLLLVYMAQDHSVSTSEGLILVAGLISYCALQIGLVMRERKLEKELHEVPRDLAHPAKDTSLLVGGVALLVGGASFFVDGAVLGARLLGWSEAIISLTIIAAGTSLPEVATSVAATLKGERGIAVGNVVGSNIFNILAVVGLTSIISFEGLKVSGHMASTDLVVMGLISFICLPFCFWRKKIDRLLGLFLFSSWVGYTSYLISLT